MAVETLRENTFSHSGDKQTFYWVSSQTTSPSFLPGALSVQSLNLLSLVTLEPRDPFLVKYS